MRSSVCSGNIPLSWGTEPAAGREEVFPARQKKQTYVLYKIISL